MKLRGWSIDGFGVFYGYNVGGLSDGLTVVFGPNEAGKSTLLAFIRNTLFGYPDGRSTETRYLPLRGGKHGGRLFVQGAAGEAVIGREAGRAATVLLPDSRMGTDSDLEHLLGHADRALFRAVFAFGLAELQDFDTLNSEGIRERIFSVGITGAGKSARSAAQELEKRAADVARGFRPLTEAVSSAHTRLKQARDNAVEHPALTQAESTAEAQRSQLDDKIELDETHKRDLERLVSAWPSFYRRKQAEEQLALLPVVDNFPANAETRLAQLTERLERRRESVEELEALQHKDELERQAITVDDRLPLVGAQLERLSEECALHLDLLRQLPQLQVEIRRAGGALHVLLGDLGPGWDIDRLNHFDRSIPQQETVRAWGTKLRDAQELLAAAATKLQASQEDERAQTERVRILTSRLGDTEPRLPEEIERLDSALRALRATLATLRDTESAMGHKRALLEDRERDLETVGGDPISPLRTAIGTLAFALLAAGLVGLGGNWAGATVMFAGGVIAAGLLARMQSAAGERHRGRVATLRKRVDEARAAGAGVEGDAAALRETALASASTLGLGDLSWEAVEDADRGLRAQAHVRSEWDRRRSELDDGLHELERVSQRVETYTRAVSEAEAKSNSVRTEWDEWKSAELVREELTPDGVLELFETVRQARAAARDLSTREEEHAELIGRIAEWESVAQAVIGVQDAGEPLVAEIRVRYQTYLEDRERRTRVDHLNRAMAARAAEITRAGEAVTAVKGAHGQLIAEGGAADEADFHQRAATSSELVRLSSIIGEADRELVTVIGLDDKASSIRTQLGSGHLSEWKEGITDAEKRLGELRELRDDALISERQARADREHLEASADVAKAELEYEAALTELTGVVRRWQSVVLAKELVQRTLDRFIRDRQPEVLASSSPIFSAITGNRYERVVQDEDGDDVLVVDPHGGARGVDALSAGTAQQLYLAMRLALVDEFAKAGIDLPLVLDDVLVNFDPVRAKAMAQVLVDYSRHKQVLLFTCHPETRDALLATDRSIPVLEVAPVEPTTLPEQPAIRQAVLELGSDAPGYESSRDAPDETAAAILSALEGRPLALSEVVALTQLDEARCARLLRQLQSAGQVEVTGHARGARWHRIGVVERQELE